MHRLSGIVTPASAAYTTDELVNQLQTSASKAIFTCVKLLPTALKAARACNITSDRVYLLQLPDDPISLPKHATFNDLVAEGKALPKLEALKWAKGQGKRQTAFLSYSSGTSGLPVGDEMSSSSFTKDT